MKVFGITFSFLLISQLTFGQDASKLNGTWILDKITVDNQNVELNTDMTLGDTIFIYNGNFEQRTFLKNEKPYRQKGLIKLTKNRIVLSKRETSTSDQYGPPVDIYYRYKIKAVI